MNIWCTEEAMPEPTNEQEEEEQHSFPDYLQQDEQQPTIFLDENGFPELFSNEKMIDNHERHNICNESSKDETFMADFYKCGSDWSCLRLKEDSLCDSKKKMKQTSLFQMWGVKKEKSGEEGSNEKLKQRDLFQMWGIEKKKSGEEMRGKKLESGVSSVEFDSSTGKGDSSGWKLGGKSQSFGVDSKRKSRACPFYKKMPGTPFTVDAFRYGAIRGCSAYFLSHFHADHYGGLSKAWSHGRIYCTPITARLVRMCLYVNPLFICPLELDVEHDIEGIKVTLLEANHCPGAALIHFNLPDGKCYLHTGDFRASKLMQSYSLLLNKQVNLLYLDTTYCNPKYRFPSKEEVTSFVVRTTKACLTRQPRTLVIVGAYSIGKECVYIAISEALGVKIYANASRRRILQSFDWPQLSKRLCSDGKDTPLHVLPISSLRHETLKIYLKTYQDKFNAVVAFRPTGWTFSESIGNQLDLIKPNSKGNIQIYGVPYSEHSSFTELQEFVQFLKPEKIIATVNISSAATREKQQSYFREWLNG